MLIGDDGWSYRVDGSLHVLNAPAEHPYETDYFRLLQETGAYDKITWTKKRSIHRLVLDKEPQQREWTIFTDPDLLVQELASKGWPKSGAAIRGLLNQTAKIVDQVSSISDMQYINSTLSKAKEVAHLLAKCPDLMASMSETAADMSEKFIKDPDLRAILTSPVMYCAVPDKVLAGIMFAEMAGMWFKYVV